MRRTGWAALGLGSAFAELLLTGLQPSPEEAKGPWCELDRGSTLKRMGGGLYRQMEVITMAVVAILIAAAVVALVFLGIFLVLGAAFYIMCSLS